MKIDNSTPNIYAGIKIADIIDISLGKLVDRIN
jgi:hypothetical protein